MLEKWKRTKYEEKSHLYERKSFSQLLRIYAEK